MISLLEGYIQDSLPYGEDLFTHPSLTDKVDQNGRIIPYHGNTTVFLLSEDTKAQVAQLQGRLYRAAPDMLAEKLEKDTLHMTLHSLAEGKPGTPGLEDWMDYACDSARQHLEGWKTEGPLSMKGTWMFNMCRTSIVLGLAPADEDSAQRLSGMYERLEQVRFLGYDMTPHITLAYFKPGRYTPDQVERLRRALGPAELRVALKMEDLVIQNFQSMNAYHTVW